MIRTPKKRFFLLPLIFITIAAIAQENRVAQIDSFVHRANQLGLFNGNILVADNQQVIYKTAIGYADVSKQTRLTQQYRFHIGSIAKEFNAVSIMMLKEQGKLGLNDKVSKFLPQLPKWADSIQVIHLLQYTSGLPDVQWKTVTNDADNMENLKKVSKLNFTPGSNYAYNNNNTFLQRKIIEQITGLPFKKFVEEKIVKPCNMTTAVVDPTEQDVMVARAYNNDNVQDALTYPISGWTAVTLDDFYKWSQCINTFKLITPASTRAILIPVGPNKQAGLGGGSMEGSELINHVHDGTSQNYQALLFSDSKKGRTVILMTNNKNYNLYDFNTAIQAILDGKPYQQAKKTLLRAFQKDLDTLSGAAILGFYKNLQSKHKEDYAFENESTLNEIGYFLLGKNRLEDAITVFEYNTQLFPTSGNVFDSLAEAYHKQGDKPKALLNYKQAVRLDPTNKAAKDVIAELEK